MELKVKDRLLVKTFVPEQGDMLKMKIVKEIMEKVELSKEELEALEVKSAGQGVQWNSEKDTGVEINFDKAELELLKEGVEKELQSTSN